MTWDLVGRLIDFLIALFICLIPFMVFERWAGDAWAIPLYRAVIFGFVICPWISPWFFKEYLRA